MENRNHGQIEAIEIQLKGWFIASSQGDNDSYSEFLVNLTRYLRGFFRKRMQACPDQVEDLVQEVLLAIHVKRHTYDSKLPITAWIHSIAKYKYIDFLRARRHFITIESLDDSSELFGQCDNAPQEAQRDMEKLLLTLPDSFRIPIQLTKLEGHSVKEASKISGMSESAIKIGVHRGLKKLASTLGFEYEH
jgi:RNA polymerase sigma-70 factor, ECF subfamily